MSGDYQTAQHWLKVARRHLREAKTAEQKAKARKEIAYWQAALGRAR